MGPTDMPTPQDAILRNLQIIAIDCADGLHGTKLEQQELRQAITYVRNLYGRTVDQHAEIQDYCHQLGLPTEVQALPEGPFSDVVSNLQELSFQCGRQGVLLPEWSHWVSQALEYIGNLRNTIADWQRIIKDLDDRLRGQPG